MCRLILFLFCLLNSLSLQAFHLDGRARPKKLNVHEPLPVQDHFKQARFCLSSEQVVTEPLGLLQAAKDALRYIKRHEARSIHLIDPVHFSSILSLDAVKKTLQFIAQTIEQDKKNGDFRILKPSFLNKHFSSIAWKADTVGAQKHRIALPADNKIRLTSYAVFSAQGSREKTDVHNCALYTLLDDSIAKRFSKQEIVAGALEQKSLRQKSRALAWVSREVLEDALMNGTVLVTFPDDGSCLLNVHLNNGYAYDKALADRTDQKRYWFFKDIGSKAHEAKSRVERIKNRKDVIFAGDLQNIGLGKVIALRHNNPKTNVPELRLGILADAGSAFHNNLYQLDYFAGLLQGRDQLRSVMSERPSFTQACILYKYT
jgi:hypothetical protein